MPRIDPNSDQLLDGQPSLPLADWLSERVRMDVRSISIGTVDQQISVASAKATLELVLKTKGFKRNEFSAFKVTAGFVTISRLGR